MAHAGVCSRREAERFIAAGRVAVNGIIITEPGHKMLPTDTLSVDGKPVAAPSAPRLFLFHKPRGYVCTNYDPQGRPTIFTLLPTEPRLISIGRLDINTEGLLLLTTNGDLSRAMELPASGWLRRYRVRVNGAVRPEQLTALKDGITVEGVRYGSIMAHLERAQGANSWLTLDLREGKNREIKNVLGALGLVVSRLIRTDFGTFTLGDLPKGALVEVPVPEALKAGLA